MTFEPTQFAFWPLDGKGLVVMDWRTISKLNETSDMDMGGGDGQQLPEDCTTRNIHSRWIIIFGVGTSTATLFLL